MTLRHLRGGVALIGTAAEFASANPVLLERQLSLETDTGVEKIGDGTTHYTSLSAIPGGGGGGGGGGYAPGSDWITVFAMSQTQVVSGTTYVAFVADNDPPPRGTSITWDPEVPQVVNINTDGVYDVCAKLLFTNHVDFANTKALLFCEIMLNGDEAGPFYNYDLFPIIFPDSLGANSTLLPAQWTVPGVALAAGDTLRLAVQDVGGDGHAVVQECVMTVSRIA